MCDICDRSKLLSPDCTVQIVIMHMLGSPKKPMHYEIYALLPYAL
jgi:hypothetical protein